MVAGSTPHPAKYSDGIIEKMRGVLRRYLGAGEVLDPFAGTGLIHELYPEFVTTGVEIEPEWAVMHGRTVVGDALCLPPDWTERFHAVCTSVTYGNRMADHQEPHERCKTCGARGWVVEGQSWDNPYGEPVQCPKCGGTGNNEYKRLTYRHQLGRPLDPNNSGGMQWGPKYRDFHLKAWAEVTRVLKWGGYLLLNVSDHVRKGEIQEVSQWHVDVLKLYGYTLIESYKISTRRMKFGANRNLRTGHEWLFVFTKQYLPPFKEDEYGPYPEEPKHAREDRGGTGEAGGGEGEPSAVASVEPAEPAEPAAGPDDRPQPLHPGTGAEPVSDVEQDEGPQPPPPPF